MHPTMSCRRGLARIAFIKWCRVLCSACCLTLCVLQDAAVSAGRGASGEEIEADGIVKGHACSLISAKDVTADGYVWLCAVEL